MENPAITASDLLIILKRVVPVLKHDSCSPCMYSAFRCDLGLINEQESQPLVSQRELFQSQAQSNVQKW